MRLTDKDWRTLLVSDPSHAQARYALAQSNIARLVRMIPSPIGTWRGKQVILDDKGAYSSGYWVFKNLRGYPPDGTWDEIERDPETQRSKQIKAEIERCRQAGGP